MRFKLGENIPTEVGDVLAGEGYDVATVPGQGLRGAKDAKIGRVCQQERMTLVTFDLHFSDIRVFPPNEYSGLIVLRLRRQDTVSVLSVFESLVPFIRAEPLDGHLWIVEEESIRIRSSHAGKEQKELF